MKPIKTQVTPIKRTAFMQLLMVITRDEVALEAIQNGWEGAWERLIAEQLKRHQAKGTSEAEVIIEAAGGDLLKAAYLITTSEIIM